MKEPSAKMTTARRKILSVFYVILFLASTALLAQHLLHGERLWFGFAVACVVVMALSVTLFWTDVIRNRPD